MRTAKAEAAQTWTEQSRDKRSERDRRLLKEGTTGRFREPATGIWREQQQHLSGERDKTDKKRKADEEQPEDPERSDGNWMRSEGAQEESGR